LPRHHAATTNCRAITRRRRIAAPSRGDDELPRHYAAMTICRLIRRR
jgi:hypothetical protein